MKGVALAESAARVIVAVALATVATLSGSAMSNPAVTTAKAAPAAIVQTATSVTPAVGHAQTTVGHVLASVKVPTPASATASVTNLAAPATRVALGAAVQAKSTAEKTCVSAHLWDSVCGVA